MNKILYIFQKPLLPFLHCEKQLQDANKHVHFFDSHCLLKKSLLKAKAEHIDKTQAIKQITGFTIYISLITPLLLHNRCQKYYSHFLYLLSHKDLALTASYN